MAWYNMRLRPDSATARTCRASDASLKHSEGIQPLCLGQTETGFRMCYELLSGAAHFASFVNQQLCGFEVSLRCIAADANGLSSLRQGVKLGLDAVYSKM